MKLLKIIALRIILLKAKLIIAIIIWWCEKPGTQNSHSSCFTAFPHHCPEPAKMHKEHSSCFFQLMGEFWVWYQDFRNK